MTALNIKKFQKQFIRERRRALMSLDEKTIRRYLAKNGEVPPRDPKVFWAGIHKVRTSLKSLPREVRLESKRWLEDRGLMSMDDGDLQKSS